MINEGKKKVKHWENKKTKKKNSNKEKLKKKSL